jgi:transcriptional regulator with XRE-family HTH domain
MLTYDPGPAREHIKALRAGGMSTRQIAQLSGVSWWMVDRLIRGVRGRPVLYVRPDIVTRILKVRQMVNPEALVDATAAARRLQALVAIGWTQKALAGRLGRHPRKISALISARPGDGSRIRVSTDMAIEALYDELTCARNRMPPAPDESTPQARAAVRHARELARRHRWPGPGAWDDETIGDPAAEPADGWQRSTRTTRRSADLVAEVEDLAVIEGFDRRQAAERLGVTRDMIEAAYKRTRNPAA